MWAKEILDEMIEANKRILGGIEIKFQKVSEIFMILKLFGKKYPHLLNPL